MSTVLPKFIELKTLYDHNHQTIELIAGILGT